MTDTPLTPVASLNLEYYKKQAKAMLKAARSGDTAAHTRMRRFEDGEEPALHVAQRVIAHEQGFASWPKFQAFLIESKLDFQGLVERFISAATSDGRRARDMLADHPGIEKAGVYVALVLGDWEKIAGAIAEDPDWVTTKSGPENVEPLAYVCFSRFAHPRSRRAPKLALTARLLLENGADPNAAAEGDHGRLPCLYAASGLLNNTELTRILLDAGADPNDNESLYHACEHPDLACLRLLLDNGGDANSVNVLKHMLDWESPDGVRLLLEAGANPNEATHMRDTALHWAVRRGRSVEVIRLLLDHGADIDAVRSDGRTAYAMAAMSDQDAVAGLLASRGADTRLSALDAYVAGEDVAVPRESTDIPANTWMLCTLAESGNVRAVARMLDAGVAIDARGSMGETALHWACWKGNVELMKLLLGRGAPLDIKETTYNAPPAGWLHHGSTNYGLGDYAECARLLIAAGGWTESTPSGNPELDATLREKGLIT
ncbi:MAG: ankyrin repeat domain-containing protein [Asticcacaulis sp.]